jgi:hypothetical protein
VLTWRGTLCRLFILIRKSQLSAQLFIVNAYVPEWKRVSERNSLKMSTGHNTAATITNAFKMDLIAAFLGL